MFLFQSKMKAGYKVIALALICLLKNGGESSLSRTNVINMARLFCPERNICPTNNCDASTTQEASNTCCIGKSVDMK
jgi:hypothetical protein